MTESATFVETASEIASLLARGYRRHRRRLALGAAHLSAAHANKPLDEVTPARKVKGRGKGALHEEGCA